MPLLASSAVLMQLNVNVLWRYFSWCNQTLAMIALWVATSYMLKNAKKKAYSFITAIPATFMSAVSVTYIMMAPEGFKLPAALGYPLVIAFAVILFVVFLILGFFRKKTEKSQ